MKFEIEIRQESRYGGSDIIHGQTESYEDAILLMNLIMSMCNETEVELTAILSNKNKKESEAK